MEKLVIIYKKSAQWYNIGLHNNGRIASNVFLVEDVFLDNYE
jgi:hypothetical protein